MLLPLQSTLICVSVNAIGVPEHDPGNGWNPSTKGSLSIPLTNHEITSKFAEADPFTLGAPPGLTATPPKITGICAA